MRPDAARRIGVLMNTRGLTELIVLEVGHRAGILPTPMVLALVIMALVTTAMTGPLLTLVDRTERRDKAPVRPPLHRSVASEGSTP
jgi:Kef-type K+ transport system membrane component KefB